MKLRTFFARVCAFFGKKPEEPTQVSDNLDFLDSKGEYIITFGGYLATPGFCDDDLEPIEHKLYHGSLDEIALSLAKFTHESPVVFTGGPPDYDYAQHDRYGQSQARIGHNRHKSFRDNMRHQRPFRI